MKKTHYIVYSILGLFLVMGCAKEEAVPVFVDFELDIFKDDYSIPVQVVLINKTNGADTYQWAFEGAVPSQSSQRNPGFITYDTKGVYTIVLTASNQDGSQDTKKLEIKIDAPVVVDFNITSIKDTFSPASFMFNNLSSGATSYLWTFDRGVPESSNKQNPDTVIFKAPGEHTITLKVSNGRETYELQKNVTVDSFLEVDFTYEVDFEDDDFEVPVAVKFNNLSNSATSYSWVFEGATPSTSTLSEPEVIFNKIGTQTITLTATNDKETKSISKEIITARNTNLRIFKDIKLGINTAHNASTVGSFYSIAERKVYTAEELVANPLAEIDLVYFGLNSSFEVNRFVSPNMLGGTTFNELSVGRPTKFINSQELCNCSAALSTQEFDTMHDANILSNLIVSETPGGLEEFDSNVLGRIILFKTEEGRKGAIKIKNYIDDGQNSYIIIDIKIQKQTD